MKELLASLKSFLEKEENTYGFTVRKVKVTDSLLVSIRRTFNHKPDSNDTDEMIQQLRKYINRYKAIEKNFPMMNMFQADANEYEVMVAIPVDRLLPATAEFVPKTMVKGNLLEAEIQGGGLHTIEKAMQMFENYRSEHQYLSPAIPYQLIVTDRIKEPDSLKWITRLYYPIF
jgi:hypothetical protein